MTWVRAASRRALKTAAESALAVIGTNAIGVTDVDWIGVVSAAALGAIVSYLMSLAGLPEVDGGKSPLTEGSDN